VGRAPGEILIVDRPQERNGDTGWFPSLAFDAAGVPHLAWCDARAGDERDAVRDGESWRMQLVDTRGAVGKYISMTLDGAGRPHLVYYHQDDHLLRYARRDDEGWRLFTVDVGVETGMAARLVLDAQGRPHVTYYTADSQLRHATLAPGHEDAPEPVFRPMVLDRDAGGAGTVSTSLLWGPDGALWASYVDWRITESALKVARLTPAGWHVEIVDDNDGPGWSSALAFEPDGRPVIAYTEHSRHEIVLARRADDGTWSRRYLADHGNRLEMAATGDGGFVIAYEQLEKSRYGKGALRLARVHDNRARLLDVDPTRPVAAYLSLALTPAGKVAVAYYDRRYRALRLYEEEPPAAPPEGEDRASLRDGGSLR
jgi:hypothetical protein